MSKLGRVSPLSKSKISIIGLGKNKESGASFWGIPGWGGMRQPKQLLLLMRCGLTWLRYVIFTTLILCIFGCNFLFHISMIFTLLYCHFKGIIRLLHYGRKGVRIMRSLSNFLPLILQPVPFKFPQTRQPQIVMKSVSSKRNLPMRHVRHIVPSWMMMIATIPT